MMEGIFLWATLREEKTKQIFVGHFRGENGKEIFRRMIL